MTRDSHNKSRGKELRSRALRWSYADVLYAPKTLLKFPNSPRLIHSLTLMPELINSHVVTYYISRITVTDIAQPCGVNAMKVSER
jgi:hypothetical protein